MRLAIANLPRTNPPADPAVEAFKQARLDELARMRDVGIDCATRIGLAFCGKLGMAETAELAGKDGLMPRFFRTERAVRQIVILEMELLGLRTAPDRDRVREENEAARERRDGDPVERGDPDDRDREWSDYDAGPYDQVVARVRRELRTEAPANDPFAAPPSHTKTERKAPERKAPERKKLRRVPATPRPGSPASGRGMSAKVRKIVYGPVVTLRMALCARGDVLPVPHQGLKARYLAGEFGRGRGPPG